MANLKGDRYVGIELGGSRRTAVVALDYFPAEARVFVAGIVSPPQADGEESPDETLIRVVNEMNPLRIGIDAPLTLPPCVTCELTCPTVAYCEVPAVRWMREESERLRYGRGKLPTPFTQRPVDLLLRGRWQEEAFVPFPVDESFGSSRAPLAARMQYLQRHLRAEDGFLEVNPRLALGGMAQWYGLMQREVRRSRDVDDGMEIRLEILDALAQEPRVIHAPQIFLYNSDISALAQDISAFDAFVCALMALADALNLLEEPDFDPAWGFVAKPTRLLPRRTGVGE
jgi:predicted nuclease with RNAse H fold